MVAFQARLDFQKRRGKKSKKQEQSVQLANKKLLIQFEEAFCMSICLRVAWGFLYALEEYFVC